LKYGKKSLAPLLFQAIEDEKLTTEYYSGEWHDIETSQRLKDLNNRLN